MAVERAIEALLPLAPQTLPGEEYSVKNELAALKTGARGREGGNMSNREERKRFDELSRRSARELAELVIDAERHIDKLSARAPKRGSAEVERDKKIAVLIAAMDNSHYGTYEAAVQILDGKEPTIICQQRGLAVARALGWIEAAPVAEAGRKEGT